MRHTIPKRWLLPLGALLIAAVGFAGLEAQPPGPKGKGKGSVATGPFETVQGTVKDFTSAPKGEVDGVTLTDGTWVHWPPHLADRFATFIERGDKVRVLGRREVDPKGESKLEVSTLTNLRTGKSRQNEDLPPPQDSGAPGAAGLANATGLVRSLTSAPKGEVDGAMLNDGTWIHWPPHLADRFTAVVREGDKVKAAGRWETGPKGDTKLEVATVTNLRTGKSADNDDLPAAGPGRVAPAPGGDIDRRLQALEARLDALVQELQRLKNKR